MCVGIIFLGVKHSHSFIFFEYLVEVEVLDGVLLLFWGNNK